MELISTFLYNSFSFIVILTVIVFVHEFGHYFVAKIFGVKIEEFSIGFGKEIFGFNDKTGTRWKVSCLPLGGYVKMFGDMDPASAPDTEKIKKFTKEEEKLAFHSKSLPVKAAVVSAGPIANFLLAIAILTFTYLSNGRPVNIPEVSYVQENSPAATAGIQAGDIIIEMDGEKVDDVNDVQRIISINTGTPVDIKVRRNDKLIDTIANVELNDAKSIFGDDIKVPFLGIRYSSMIIPVIDEVQTNSAAEEAGLKKGDLITQIDFQKIKSFSDIVNIISENNGTPVTITAKRKEIVTLEATPKLSEKIDRQGNKTHESLLGLRVKRFEGDNFDVKQAAPQIDSVKPGSPADVAGIKPGDLILTINEKGINSFADVQKIITDSTDKTLSIQIERLSPFSTIATPKITTYTDENGAEKNRALLGIQAQTKPKVDLGLASSVKYATIQTYDYAKMTLKAIGQMVTGSRNATEISGPIGIAKYSGQSFERGIDTVLWFIVILSVNLGLINLFPIPVLDGGHLFYYAIEAVRGKPLADRYQQYGFRFGLILIVALAIFAVINDVRKLNIF